MNTRAPLRVPSPTATADRPAPVEMAAAPNNLPAVAAPSQNGATIMTATPAAPLIFPVTGVAKIAGAISSVMSEIGIVGKDGRNEFHKYNYAKMEDVLQRLTPLIAKNGLAIIQTELDRSMFDDDRAIAVRYGFTIIHASGEVWPERPVQTGLSRCRDSKGGFDDKCLNKAHTAARKYFLLALFQIPTGDEDDADAGRNDGAPQRQSAPPRRAPVPSPTGHIAPYAIPTNGEKAQTWAPKFLAVIPHAESEGELAEWDKLNDLALNIVNEKAPQLYQDIVKAVEKRRAELAPKAPDATPTKPKADGIPDAATMPEEFLKWADAQMAAVTDPHALDPLYNDMIEPQATGLFPPDKEELAAMHAKHERRLEP